MEGWIKLHRKLLSWEWWKKSKALQVFFFFLLTANHEEKKWRGITIKRGQLLTSRETLAKSTNLSQRSIRTCITRQKTTNEVTSQPTSRYTMITICKYDSYQENKNANDQPNDQ